MALIVSFRQKISEGIGRRSCVLVQTAQDPWHWTAGLFYKDATLIDDSEAIVGDPSACFRLYLRLRMRMYLNRGQYLVKLATR